MRYPIIKNTLWFFLLTTFLLATFQPLLLEVAHRVAHLGDQTHHHSFHQHTADHTHIQLIQFAEATSKDDPNGSSTTLTKLNFKPLIAVLPDVPLPVCGIEHTTKVFIPSFILPPAVFLACETPPPDAVIDLG